MTTESTRRDVLKQGLALAGLSVFGLPEWAFPALAQGETVVPFTDIDPPEKFNATPTPDRRLFDVRTIDGPITPKDKFFTTQHYGHPEVDPAAFRLKVSGLVDKPLSLSLDDLRKMKQHGAHRRLRVFGQPPPAPGALRQRPLDRRPAPRGARSGGREAAGARVRVLRRRSRQGGGRVPRQQLRGGAAVRPQHAARQGDVAGAAARVCAQR